jgi:hypothetical protein
MQTGYLSTTKLLKIAHEATDGNIAEAIEVLRPMQQDHVEAYSAIRVRGGGLMRIAGSVPARSRSTFAAHFRRAYAQGWTWSVARILARPKAQNERVRGVVAYIPAIYTVKAA